MVVMNFGAAAVGPACDWSTDIWMDEKMEHGWHVPLTAWAVAVPIEGVRSAHRQWLESVSSRRPAANALSQRAD